MFDHDADPPRLAEDPSHRALFDALRADRPSEASSARVLEAIDRPRPTTGWLRRWGVVGVAVVLSGIGLYAGLQFAPRDEVRPPRPAVVGAASERSMREERSVDPPPPSVELVAEERAATQRRAAPPTEEELILRARGEVRSNPAAAARTLGRHARLYPRGVLAIEREALSAELRVRRGSIEDARAALARFEEAHPSSAHRERLRRLLDTRDPPP